MAKKLRRDNVGCAQASATLDCSGGFSGNRMCTLQFRVALPQEISAKSTGNALTRGYVCVGQLASARDCVAQLCSGASTIKEMKIPNTYTNNQNDKNEFAFKYVIQDEEKARMSQYVRILTRTSPTVTQSA